MLQWSQCTSVAHRSQCPLCSGALPVYRALKFQQVNRRGTQNNFHSCWRCQLSHTMAAAMAALSDSA